MWKARGVLAWTLGFLVLMVLIWAYYPVIADRSLTFKWEGALKSKINFRDTGASLNACLGQPVFRESVLFRASEFFSGWSCDKVGRPDVILSLNENRQQGEKFYCRAESSRIVGESFQDQELSDLEFLETWDQRPEFVVAACQHIRRAMQSLHDEKKVLIHCEAGRDRTGAMSGLLGALIWETEHQRPVSGKLIEAIECDYRKSFSLKPEKYGRMSSFLNDIRRDYVDVTGFLESKCGGLP